MDEHINLRGLVVSRFGSVARFSKEIGWCYSKASRIVSGKQEPDASEIKAMACTLRIENPATVASIFLS